MQKAFLLLASLYLFSFVSFAQFMPRNKQLGFGLTLGEPLGASVAYSLTSQTSLQGAIGLSYYGSPRIQADHLWHFDAFRNNEFSLYAGAGAVIGIGEGKGLWNDTKAGFYYRSSGVGLAVRGVFGAKFIPQGTDFDIFVEMGPLFGLVPDFGSAFDAAVGVRYYPN